MDPDPVQTLRPVEIILRGPEQKDAYPTIHYLGFSCMLLTDTRNVGYHQLRLCTTSELGKINVVI